MAELAYQQIRYEKPDIQIFYAEQLEPARFAELLHGIEEEGLPFVTQAKSGSDAVGLAFRAAESSRLGVGIGICSDRMVLHFEKLAPDAPLFTIPANATGEMQRALGANAARLVKKLPFKKI